MLLTENFTLESTYLETDVLRFTNYFIDSSYSDMGHGRECVNGTTNTMKTIQIAHCVHWAFLASNWIRSSI